MMFDINDSRASLIAEVLGNKTCTKILSLLAEKEMSETDLAKALKLPANTAHYNVQKLVSAGFVEPASKFFWSAKGKKIVLYKISNKKVIISPKTSFKGILPALLGTGIVAFLVKLFTGGADPLANSASQTMGGSGSAAAEYYATDMVAKAADSSSAAMVESARAAAPYMANANDAVVQTVGASGISPWSWFLLGAWAALLIFVLFNIRRDSLN